jgi:Glycosyltransferase family 87
VIQRAGRLLSTIDRARDGLALDAGLYLLSAAFALVTGLTSTLLPHRGWGLIAVWAYLGALIVVMIQLGARRPAGRMPLTWAAWAGTALLPLVVEAVQRAGGRTDRAQDEVLVVEQMGARLLHTGTPYLGPDAIAALPLPDRLGAYAPYQPGMAVFGLPRALAGDAWWTDARIFFAVVTLAALVTAVRLLGSGPSSVRALQAATVFPICTLTLATGGDDIPVMALCLLALAWCAADRFGLAGLAVGAAAACKLFAFPVVAVLAVLALVSGRGRRFLPGAIGLPIIVLIPPFLVDGNAFVENVIRFPLGRGLVQSPAQSPFPGHLISSGLPGGRYIAAGLLVAVAVAIAVGLIRRPPRTAATAALFCGYGLLAAILLMPTTRFGYLLYPVALLAWAPALSKPTAAAAPRGDAALYRV